MKKIEIPEVLYKEALYYAFIDTEAAVPELFVNCLYRENRIIEIRFVEDDLVPDGYMIYVQDIQNKKALHHTFLAETPEIAVRTLLTSLEQDAEKEIKRFL